MKKWLHNIDFEIIIAAFVMGLTTVIVLYLATKWIIELFK